MKPWFTTLMLWTALSALALSPLSGNLPYANSPFLHRQPSSRRTAVSTPPRVQTRRVRHKRASTTVLDCRHIVRPLALIRCRLRMSPSISIPSGIMVGDATASEGTGFCDTPVLDRAGSTALRGSSAWAPLCSAASPPPEIGTLRHLVVG
jgi:hypothetical protein